MSLGVLNNLSAIYAENNLNNTNNSLTTVLQQLSSGSKINSGADDAAGLSLVDGLQANSMALAQSQTNASEGVGLLTVADGALSQVTNLLNRAVTLATEASNGTLDSSQDSAANSEYQSILSEINNIGTTTTYNQQTVFGAASPVNIYTGDSSSAGASIDSLNIASLSSSNVGDTGGVMAYSNGADNVFLNLSSSTQNAAATDALNGGLSGSTTLNVNYLVKGANGTTSTATTAISVGGNTSYANTANGLVSAINNAGLGLTATFATQSQAGVSGGGTQTGIEISGGLLSAGVDPSTSSTSGVLNPSGIAANELLTQNEQVNVTVGGASAASVTINSSVTNLSQLANAINFGSANPAPGAVQNSLVTATVVTNSNGTQSLSLASAAGKGALSVTTSGGTSSIAPAFANGGVGTAASSTSALSTTATTATAVALTPAVKGSVVVGAGSVDDGTTPGSDSNITGSFVVTNTSSAGVVNTETFVMNSSAAYSGTTHSIGVNGTTLNALMTAINSQNASGGDLGVTAAITTTGMTLTGAAGTTVAANSTGITSYTNTLTGATPALSTGAGATANVANLNVAQNNQLTDVLTGSIVLNNTLANGTSVSETFVMGGAAYSGATDSGAYGALTAPGGVNTYTVNGNTLNDLMNAINSQQTAVGGTSVALATTASYGTNGLTIGSHDNGDNVTIVGGAGGDTLTNINSKVAFYAPTLNLGNDLNGTEYATALLAPVNAAGTSITGAISGDDNLTGSITISNGTQQDTFIMGNDPTGSTTTGIRNGAAATTTGGNTYYVGNGGSVALASAINTLVAAEGDTGLNMTASTPAADGGIYLQSLAGGATISASANTLAVAQPASTTTTVSGNVGAAGTASTVDITPAVGGTSINTSDVFTGSITLVNTPASGGAVTETFTMGGAAHSGSGAGSLSGTTFTVNGNTLADLQNAINSQQTAVSGTSLALGLTSQAGTSGLSVSTTSNLGGTVTVSTAAGKTNSLTDTTTGTQSTLSMGTFTSLNDAVSGNLTFTVGGSPKPITLNPGETVQGMINQINGTTTNGSGITSSTYANGVVASWVPPASGANFGSVLLTAVNPGQNITAGTESIADTPTAATLSYTASSAYNMGISSTAGVNDYTITGQLPVAATFSSDQKASSGVATISYTDGAGQSLSASDLSNQTDAQASLKALNSAITDVAAQDGYIGAQINTLNAVSSVLSTQQENVTAAQNAVQATDYASATSNMSKYEILSQTGISALAQANSMQQEVTKLLQ